MSGQGAGVKRLVEPKSAATSVRAPVPESSALPMRGNTVGWVELAKPSTAPSGLPLGFVPQPSLHCGAMTHAHETWGNDNMERDGYEIALERIAAERVARTGTA
jgi:hypothetical protein